MRLFGTSDRPTRAPCAVARGLRSSRGDAGLTIVEVTAALALLAFGAMAVLGTMVYSLQLDATNRETVAASQAARRVLEQVRAESLGDVIVLYNESGTDDPDGPDTAPGNKFAVTLLEKAIGGMGVDGTVVLPLGNDGVIRENANIPELGMPRDLNGDGVIDGDDRSGDLLILPVIVRVTWDGINGDRSVAYSTVLR